MAASEDQRIAELRLTQVRQELLAPASAIVGYAAMLQEALDHSDPETKQDLARIETAAQNLTDTVDQLLSAPAAQALRSGHDVGDVERELRHDLRSPINAVKGYAEMLLEDVDEGALRTDLENLLAETDRLLGQLPRIVDLSYGHTLEREADVSTNDAMFADVARSIAPESPAPNRSGHILVVDDLEANRQFVKRRLEREGHTVQTASSGREALATVQEVNVDLILLDVMMPEMNGFDVLVRLKTQPRNRDIPVLMVSALEENAWVIRCIERGAEDYLQKPLDPVLLRARIGACIEKMQLRRETTRLLARLEQEVAEARQQQLNMVRADFPAPTANTPVSVHAIMEPAREVGGDFYDFFTLGDRYFYAVVGDAADKGVGAGMFMARARSVLRLAAADWHQATGVALGPDAILNLVNRELCDCNPDMNFITLVLLRLDTDTGLLAATSAGHIAPKRVGAGGVSDLGVPLQPPAGVREGFSYGVQEDTLAPGEKIVIFSDGVIEASNSADELYADTGLTAFLANTHFEEPQHLVESLVTDLKCYIGESTIQDDITILGFSWIPSFTPSN